MLLLMVTVVSLCIENWWNVATGVQENVCWSAADFVRNAAESPCSSIRHHLVSILVETLSYFITGKSVDQGLQSQKILGNIVDADFAIFSQ